ncbi:hypothetical protein [Paramicrobacterium agarici]|uniref:hypothetical protein n=1 Tax=Paramicrobacterium agarici TaxID=630514 RepID=UPI0011540D4D|nr:hypothetical protein [Microbacterium agarici]TQO23827.1 hypothetical protein FB385_2689 [Microbacterium agarici]
MTDQSNPEWADEYVPIPIPRHDYPRMRNRDPEKKVAQIATVAGLLVIIGIITAVGWVIGA